MQNNNIVLGVHAPSGTGKGTVVGLLIEMGLPLETVVSWTTRQPRKGEVPGKSYHYVDVPTFRQAIDINGFLEYEEVYENCFYGTPNGQIEDIWSISKIPVLDIDTQGAIRAKRKLGSAMICVGMIPAHTLELTMKILQDRLCGRNTENPADIQKRLNRAPSEFRSILRDSEFDVLVVNGLREPIVAATEIYEYLVNHGHWS